MVKSRACLHVKTMPTRRTHTLLSSACTPPRRTPANFSRGAFDAGLGDAGAGVDEGVVDEVGGEDLQLVAEAISNPHPLLAPD
jgi:hypothetical protein